MLRLTTFAMTLALMGCKKDAPTSPAAKAPDPADALKAFAAEVLAPVQAAVPADGPKVTFEAKLLDDDRIALTVPTGWTVGVIPGRFKPPDDAKLGFMTQFGAGGNCDGMCEPKDWKATADKVEFAQFKSGSFSIIKDEPLTNPEGRLVVASADGGKRLYLVVARWKDGAERYFNCRATLEESALKLLPALELACKKAQPLFLQ